MSNILSFDFNVWAYKEEELVSLASLLLADCTEKLNIAPLAIKSLCEKISSHYFDLPYHNFRHAIDVTQFVFVVIEKKGLDPYLGPWEQFALLLTALCHDIGHKGRDNAYQIRHKTPLFEKYGKKSPLEKHHMDLTLDILREFDKEVFATLDPEKISALLQLVGNWILSTDISQHDYWMEQIQSKESLSPQLAGILVIKSADLGQYIRKEEVKKVWEGKILEEFFLQHQEDGAPEDKEEFIESFVKKQEEFFTTVSKPLLVLLEKKLKIKVFR